jgi:uncharacterized protein (TIGR02118 family)
MATKLVALWSTPDDVDGFEIDYVSTHLPLVDKMSGLTNVIESKALHGPYYRMAEMIFEDADALGASMATDEGSALLADSGRLQKTYGTKLDVLIVQEQ